MDESKSNVTAYMCKVLERPLSSDSDVAAQQLAALMSAGLVTDTQLLNITRRMNWEQRLMVVRVAQLLYLGPMDYACTEEQFCDYFYELCYTDEFGNGRRMTTTTTAA